MDGHSILGTYDWMAQLQICRKERVGEGAYSRESYEDCQKFDGGPVSRVLQMF